MSLRTKFLHELLRVTVVATVIAAAAMIARPAGAQTVLRNLELQGVGHSDVAWFDFYYDLQDHWIQLAGTALLQTPCGDRELAFQFEAFGRENFQQDTYTYDIDLPQAHFVLTDPLANDLLITEATLKVTLRCRYPRPIGPAVWTLFGDWTSAYRREFLADCTWSALSTEPYSATISFRPDFGDPDGVGVTVSASGYVFDAIGTPVPVSGTRSLGVMKARYRD